MSVTGQHRLPDFMIVGAMRGGTTSLAHYLDEHPDIYIRSEEAHFFDRGKNWRRGAKYYAQFFCGHRGEMRVGEKTPAYSFRPHHQPPIPVRIAAMLPDVQLIWCLRNPVKRAYSHWWHTVWRGRERATFEDALQRESSGPVKPSCAYRERGVYVRQIRAFMEVFSLQRMHFVVSEEFFRQPGPTVRQVFEFLLVDARFEGKRVDTAWSVSRRIMWPLVVHAVFAKVYQAQRGHPGRQKLLRLLTWRDRPEMQADTGQLLQEFYEPYNAELAALTGLDLTMWQST